MAAPSYLTPSSRWLAVQSRDPLSSEAFVYCVRTTNIYCRPTCAARLARRANVEFRDNAADAEKDGYRACKRCKPDLAEDWDPWSKIIRDACKRIEDAVKAAEEEEDQDTNCDIDEEDGDIQNEEGERLNENPSTGRGGGRAGGGTTVLGKRRRKSAGKIRSKRREETKLSELAKGAGLTESHFHRVFKKVTGMTPKEYRNSVSRKEESRDPILEVEKFHPSMSDEPEFSITTPAESNVESIIEANVQTPRSLNTAEEDPEILDIDDFIDASFFEEWTVAGAMAVADEDRIALMPYPPALSRDRTKLRLSRQSTLT